MCGEMEQEVIEFLASKIAKMGIGELPPGFPKRANRVEQGEIRPRPPSPLDARYAHTVPFSPESIVWPTWDTSGPASHTPVLRSPGRYRDGLDQ